MAKQKTKRTQSENTQALLQRVNEVRNATYATQAERERAEAAIADTLAFIASLGSVAIVLSSLLIAPSAIASSKLASPTQPAAVEALTHLPEAREGLPGCMSRRDGRRGANRRASCQ